MSKKIRTILIIFALVMCLTVLFGCEGNVNDPAETDAPETEEQQVADESQPVSDEPGEKEISFKKKASYIDYVGYKKDDSPVAEWINSVDEFNSFYDKYKDRILDCGAAKNKVEKEVLLSGLSYETGSPEDLFKDSSVLCVRINGYDLNVNYGGTFLPNISKITQKNDKLVIELDNKTDYTNCGAFLFAVLAKSDVKETCEIEITPLKDNFSEVKSLQFNVKYGARLFDHSEGYASGTGNYEFLIDSVEKLNEYISFRNPNPNYKADGFDKTLSELLAGYNEEFFKDHLLFINSTDMPEDKKLEVKDVLLINSGVYVKIGAKSNTSSSYLYDLVKEHIVTAVELSKSDLPAETLENIDRYTLYFLIAF